MVDQVRMIYTPDVPEAATRAAFIGAEELVRELTGYPVDFLDFGMEGGWLAGFWVPERDQLDVARPGTILEMEEGKYDVDPHIDLVLTAMDLCDVTDPNMSFCVGAAMGRTMFVSVHHFLSFLQRGEEEMFHELVKQETAHELGHVLKLAVRDHHVYEALGGHCTDPSCLMHQGLTVPNDWVTMVRYRLESGSYACELCHQDAHRNGML